MGNVLYRYAGIPPFKGLNDRSRTSPGRRRMLMPPVNFAV